MLNTNKVCDTNFDAAYNAGLYVGDGHYYSQSSNTVRRVVNLKKLLNTKSTIADILDIVRDEFLGFIVDEDDDVPF